MNMWKRLLLAFMIFASMASIGYVLKYNNGLEAAASSFQLKKGQKIILGSKGGDVVWDVVNTDNMQYTLLSSTSIKDISADIGDPTCVYGTGGAYPINKSTACPLQNARQEVSNINLNSNEQQIMSKTPYLPTIADAMAVPVNDRIFKTQTFY